MPWKSRDEPTGPDAVREARRLRLHQRILRDFGRIALEDLEIGSLLQRAVAQAARATGVRHTKIMRYRTEQGDLLAAAKLPVRGRSKAAGTKGKHDPLSACPRPKQPSGGAARFLAAGILVHGQSNANRTAAET